MEDVVLERVVLRDLVAACDAKAWLAACFVARFRVLVSQG